MTYSSLTTGFLTTTLSDGTIRIKGTIQPTSSNTFFIRHAAGTGNSITTKTGSYIKAIRLS